MLKVGFIDYINAFPLNAAFRQGIIEHGCALSYHIPSQSNALLRAGDLDLSQVSSVEYLDGGHVLFPGFCICAPKRVLSVNLYVKKDITSLHKARVGLTSHSATSISLLKVLCRDKWKISPHFESLNRQLPLSDYEGFLLIGDEALEKLSIEGFQTIDLAEAWVQMTGLPFVFSVIAIRQETWKEKKSEIEMFQKRVQAALNWAENTPEVILQMAQKKCALPLQLIKEYYSLCQYRLGKKELEGLALFAELRKNVS